jgi:hypothetical protein
MSNSESKIYSISDHKKGVNKKDNTFIKSLVLLNVILLTVCLIWIFASGKYQIDPIYLPLIIVITALLGVQSLVAKLLKLYSKRVHFLKFNKDKLILKYKKGFSEDSSTLSIHSSEIVLRELRNAKSFFIGLQVIIKDKISGENYLLFDSDWSFQSLEKIYTEFKKQKCEMIPDDEKYAFQQLQIMNNSSDKHKQL